MQQPEEYGFFIDDDHLYQPLDQYKVINVEQPIPSLGAFAQQHNTTYRMIKVYNPWLISTSLNKVSGKGYEIRVPN
jgi:hypothetical protein